MSFRAPSPFNPLAAFAPQWLELYQHAGAMGRGSLAGLAFFCDPRRLRSLWLTELGQTMDRYLRSPAFLDLMQYNLSAMTRSSTSLVSPVGPK